VQTIAADEAKRRDAEQRIARRKTLELEHQALEDVVAALGPGGPVRKASTSDNDALDRVETHLRALGLQGADLKPLLAREGEAILGGVPSSLLSESERACFGIAVQIALGVTLGFPVVCVDEFEQMDGATAGLVLDLLASSRVQALVFQVERSRERFLAAAKAMPEIACFVVDGGRVERVGAAAA